jgi:hypothetical protein
LLHFHQHGDGKGRNGGVAVADFDEIF